MKQFVVNIRKQNYASHIMIYALFIAETNKKKNIHFPTYPSLDKEAVLPKAYLHFTLLYCP